MADNGELFQIKNPAHKKGKKHKATDLKAFAAPKSDGSIIIDEQSLTGAHAASYNVDFNLVYSTERNLIHQYRDLVTNAEIKSIVTDIVNEAIVMEAGNAPMEINLDSIDSITLNDKIKASIKEEWDYIMRLLKFRHECDEVFERFYVDGRQFYHKIVDSNKPKEGIKELREIDPINIKKVREYERATENGIEVVTGFKEYYLFSDNDVASRVLKIDPSAISYINSGLLDASCATSTTNTTSGQQKIVISYLHQAIRPFNQLRQLEDAHLIYTISRAPQRRVFYVDIGNLNKSRGEEYMQQNMNRYKNKMVYDSSKGTVKNDRHLQSMMEDVWLPRKGGSRGTEVDTLAGGGELGNPELLDTFRNKTMVALNYPASRQEQDSIQGFGRTSEITREETKFQKFVNKLRNKFAKLPLDILRTQIILKGIITGEDWEEWRDDIQVDFVNDSYFSELKDNEILRTRIEMLTEIEEGQYVGKYFSEEYVRKNILKQSDDEIKAMDEQIAEEKAKRDEEPDNDEMDDQEDNLEFDAEQKQRDRDHDAEQKQLDREHQLTLSQIKDKGTKDE